MAETQEASIGWGGEFWLSTDETEAALVELVQVVSFGLPETQVDSVDVTHLKSAQRRKEFTDGLADGGTAAVVLNFRPGSDTDTSCDDWEDNRGLRMVKFVVPINGVGVKSYTCLASFAGYSKGTISAGDKMEATLSVKLSGGVTRTAIP